MTRYCKQSAGVLLPVFVSQALPIEMKKMRSFSKLRERGELPDAAIGKYCVSGVLVSQAFLIRVNKMRSVLKCKGGSDESQRLGGLVLPVCVCR